MNKLFLGLALVAGSLVAAQETVIVETATITPVPEKPHARVGIKGGANASQFSDQKLSLNNQKVGFHAGVFVNVPLSNKISVQPEVLYNQMGAKTITSSSEITSPTTTTKTVSDVKNYLNYISVPLMFQFRPGSFYMEAGPQFSYFLNGKNEGETTITKTTGSSTSTETISNSGSVNKDIVRKFDIGLALGLGLDITHNLGINARYINSLTHTYNNYIMPGVEYNSKTNRVFQLGLNYKF